MKTLRLCFSYGQFVFCFEKERKLKIMDANGGAPTKKQQDI